MHLSIHAVATAATAALLAMASTTSAAKVLDFEDVKIPDPAFGEALPTKYKGLTFTFLSGPRDPSLPQGSWYALMDAPPFPSYAISGKKALFTENAYVPDPLNPGQFIPRDTRDVNVDSQPILGSLPFTFTGANFRALDDNVTLTYKLFLGGNLVHTVSTTLATFNDVAFFGTGYNGLVDKVIINGPSAYFAMDDFTFTAVPEPGTYALMIAGLGVVGWMARRRRQEQAGKEPANT